MQVCFSFMKSPPPPVTSLDFCHSLSTKQSRFSFAKPRKWDPSSQKPAWNRTAHKKMKCFSQLVYRREQEGPSSHGLGPVSWKKCKKKLKSCMVVIFSCQDSGLVVQIVQTWSKSGCLFPFVSPADFCKPWLKESRGESLSLLLMLVCSLRCLKKVWDFVGFGCG